jgi:hypothetical protein
MLIALVAACGGTTLLDGNTGGGAGTGGEAGSTGDAATMLCSGATCGGDVVGNWKFASVCGPSAFQTTIGTCAEPISMRRINPSATGTVQYRADGTYLASIAFLGTTQTTCPSACLANGTLSRTCAQLNDSAQQQAAAMAGVSSYSCAAAAAGGCMCAMTFSGQPVSETGTYSINGSVLSQRPSGGTLTSVEYCVQGNQLDETNSNNGVGFVLEKLP